MSARRQPFMILAKSIFRFFRFDSLFLPLILTISCASIESKKSATEEISEIKKDKYLIAVESGEVFDMQGSLVFKFPGTYPLILPTGEYAVNQQGLLSRYRKTGDLRFQFKDNFTHDWDFFEDERIIYFSRFYVKKDRRNVRTAELRIIDRKGVRQKRFDFYKNREKLEKELDLFIEPRFFSFTYVTKKFGIPFWCNCWEFDHFNYVHILKGPIFASNEKIIPKGTIITSLPLNQRIFGMDPVNFDIIWSLRLPDVHFFHTPVFTQRNTVLVFANNFRNGEEIVEKSAIIEYDITSGEEIFRFYLPDDLYSPISGSIQAIDENNFLISIFTGEVLLFDRRTGLVPFVDLRKNYLDRKIDFYRALLINKEIFSKFNLVN